MQEEKLTVPLFNTVNASQHPTLSSWFEQNGLSAYFEAFQAAGFETVEDLYDLERQDLEQLGVTCVPHSAAAHGGEVRRPYSVQLIRSFRIP